MSVLIGQTLFEVGMLLWPNTALEPTAAAPAFDVCSQIHACGFSRRGSALDR
jgi:hypothetical protein